MFAMEHGPSALESRKCSAVSMCERHTALADEVRTFLFLLTVAARCCSP
jgi:hypothetical protein